MLKNAKYIFLIFIMLIGGIYAITLSGDFVYDDLPFIVTNPHVKNITLCKFYFTSPYAASPSGHHLWRPLRTLSFAINYWFGGLNPLGYHLTNIILHMLMTILVYALFRNVLDHLSTTPADDAKRRMQSFWGALLFASLPVHTEVVSWVSSRGDLLYAVFGLLSFLLFIYTYNDAFKPLGCVGSMLCFVAALLSKETAVMIPGLMLLWMMALPEEKTPGWDYFRKMAFIGSYFFIGALYVYIRYRVLGEVAQQDYWGGTCLVTAMTMIKVFGMYLGLLAFPHDLRLFYEIPLVTSLATVPLILSLSGLIILILLAFWFKPYKPIIFFAIGWFFIALAPVANIVPMGGLIGERLLYVPSIGYCLLLVSVIFRGVDIVLTRFAIETVRQGVVRSLLLLCVGWYAIIALDRASDWREERGFWVKTIAMAPHSATAHHNLGITHMVHGEYQEAINSFAQALRFDSMRSLSYYGLGASYYALGDKQKAMDNFFQAIGIDPDHAPSHSALGAVYHDMGDDARALLEYQAALQLDPFLAQAYHNRGVMRTDQGDFEQAERDLERAIELDPDVGQYYLSLGYVYKCAGELDKALAYYHMALSYDRHSSLAYNNIGVVYLQQQKIDKAIDSFYKAIYIDPHNYGARKAVYNLRVLHEMMTENK